MWLVKLNILKGTYMFKYTALYMPLISMYILLWIKIFLFLDQGYQFICELLGQIYKM